MKKTSPVKNSRRIKILFLSAEIAPLAKVGGLADVLGALPKALDKDVCEIRMCLPFYGCIDIKKYPVKLITNNLSVHLNNKKEKFSLYNTYLPGTRIPVYLIKHYFFSSKKIYMSEKKNNESVNVRRFAFFTRASLKAMEFLFFQPGIIHAHDWHTALAPDMIKDRKKINRFYSRTKILYTIHNLANQGKTGGKNFMAEGILGANLVNTVSPAYAKEILTHEFGAGLEKKLQKKKKSLSGILNGIDTAEYNPQIDPLVRYHFTSGSIREKIKNKLFLQKKLGWKPDKKILLAGVVTRLTGQKGIELFTEKLISQVNSIKKPWQIVFLGTGEKKYEKQLKNLAKKYPKNIKTLIRFDEKLARQIYAGSDLFLVPSKFEPCGLTQMIAMRYGSIPIVRAT
ncbi:MAG: glycogen/starch synthase, partial [Patescibacteria group bacterium]